MAKTMKKWKKITFILVIALVVTMIPILSMAGNQDDETGSANQIGSYVDVYGPNGDSSGTEGEKTGAVYETSVLSESGLKNLNVQYSKEIEPTDTKDKFKINLNVTTNDYREEYKTNEPTDLVLVLDVSGSMDTTMIKTEDGQKTRWQIYRPAMIEFVNTFMNANPHNKVSIVAFAGNAKTDYSSYKSAETGFNPVSPAVHYNLTQGFATTTKEAIDSFNYETCTLVRGKMGKGLAADQGVAHMVVYSYTNAQAGFRGGWEALDFNYRANDNATVLFVSDGVPNEVYKRVEEKGRDYSILIGENSESVTTAVTECGIMMDKLKEKYGDESVELYTYAVGTSASSTANSKMMAPGESKNPNVKRCFTTADINIESTFNEIAYELTHSVVPWTVEDPMSEWVNFIEFDGDSDSAEFTNGKILWDLNETAPVEGSDPVTYTYSLSYYVELDTNHKDFVSGEYYPTNKETTLEYSFSYNDGRDESNELTLFRIPTVKGEKPKETFSFTKAIGSVKGDGQSSGDEFSFLVSVDNSSNFSYRIGEGETQSSTDGIITIKAGQTVYIDGLPVWTTVKVSEIDMPSFYKPVTQTQEKVIQKDGDNSITFTNNYAKSEVTAEKTGSREYDDPVWHDDEITYTIKITNTGETTAEGIAVKDAVPEFTKYKSGSITPVDNENVTGDYDDNGYVYWFIKELKTNESVDLKFTVTVTEGFTWEDLITNQAHYTYTGNPSPEAINFDNNNQFDKDTEIVTNIPPQPGMEIEKSNTPGKDTILKKGDIIEYTIKVSSTGTPDLRNVWVKDYIPAGTSYVKDTVSGNGTYKDGYVEWFVDEITKGTPAELTFKVMINDDAVNKQEIKNVALANHLGYDERGDKENPTTESNSVYNYVDVPEVQGQKANPTVKANNEDESKVLGEEASDDVEDSKVLGDEAKTSDAMKLIPLLIGLALVVLVALTILLRSRSKGK